MRYLIIILTYLSAFLVQSSSPAESVIPPTPQIGTDTSTTELLTIMAVGDIMLGTSYPSGYLPPNDNPAPLLQQVAPILQKGDITFGNLEGAFLDKGNPYKRCNDPSKCYAFKMPTRYAPTLKTAGFNMLSLANNHVGDFGPPAKKRTTKLLDSLNIRHAGLIEHPTDTLTVKRLKIGLCAFAPNSGTSPLNNDENLKSTVKKLKQTCDIVIASCHMGAEGAAHSHITQKREIYLGENRGNPYQIARTLIDAGADIVIGHGPHVTRTVDLYKGRFIAYSLGNFCTYGRFNLRGICGLAPIIELQIKPNGEFVRGKIHPTKQLGRGGVTLDSDNLVIHEIKRLAQQDLIEQRLTIDDDGNILPKNN